ncbi:MAG TPA: hypothetical protein DCS82_05785 [Rhodospirillaceae bacterium]|nr:hypothetical protein [Rhodospirillaceae bacterium]
MADQQSLAARKKLIQDRFDAAVSCQKSGKLADAVEHYREVVRLAPDFGIAWGNLGVALRALGKAEESLRCLKHAVANKPDDPGMWSNLGNAQRAVGNLAAAADAHNRAIELDRTRGQSHYNCALTLRDLGDFDAAENSFDLALEHRYDKPQLHWDRALGRLMAGDLAAGFADYHYRWQLPDIPAQHPDIEEWDGDDLAGRTLLVHAEQGLGDSIQFARYLPMLRDKGGAVVFEVQPELVRLMRGNAISEGVEIIARGEKLPPVDVKIALLTLPHIFQTRVETVPAEIPYLTSVSESGEPTPALLPENCQRATVGVCWAGRPIHKNDHNRSLDLGLLAPLLAFTDLRFVSLQKGERAHDISTHGMQAQLFDCDGLIGDFADTARLMTEIDLVITVDTAVAHLAGAMERPVWVLVPHVADWRWMMGSNESPWYPSMRLYRQKRFGEWREVIEQVARELNTLGGG